MGSTEDQFDWTIYPQPSLQHAFAHQDVAVTSSNDRVDGYGPNAASARSADAQAQEDGGGVALKESGGPEDGLFNGFVRKSRVF